MLTFIVFTFNSLLVAAQIARARLTPRIISTILLRDRMRQRHSRLRKDGP
jgi:hypothetical protein